MSKRNENRPEYKNTKVEWIPKEWRCVRLDAVACVKTGPFGAQLHENDYVEEGTPIITVEHLNELGVVHNNLPLVSDSDKERLSQYLIEEGDIVFSRVGSVDRNSLISKDEHGWLFSGRLLRVRSNRQKVFPQFLSAYLLREPTKHYIRSIAVGGTMSCLNTQLLSGVPIPLPPLSEQEKIAEILSAWDRAIEQVGKLIDAKQRLKKGLMQQLLTGRTRFPEFGPANKRVKAHFYDFSSDWKHPQVSEIASEVSERDRELINYPVLSCSKYDGFVNSLEYFGKKVYSDDTSNYKLIKQGQFGFPSNHIEEGSIGLLHHIGAGIVSPIYTIFEVNLEKVFAPYLYALFKTDTYQHVFSVNTNSSVDRRGSLRWKEFSKIRVPLPSVEEQTRIASVLSTCDREIELLRRKEIALREQKKGLMQKLLTGKVRHPEFLKEGRA